jgi:hypothetical protein
VSAGTKSALLGELRRYLPSAGHEGFIEGPNNDNPFAAQIGADNHEAWCDSYFCSAAKRAGIKGVPLSASCQASVDAYKAAGRLHTTPEVGDQGFLFFPKLGRYAHTGGVEAVISAIKIIQIEGNTDVAGGRTGGRVLRKVRNPQHLMAFGRPLFVPEPRKPAVLPTATLHVGMGPSQAILNVQKFYVRLGNKVALDGKFTPQMEHITELYQAHRPPLAVNGTVDAPTLAAIRAEIKQKGLR